MTFQVVVLPAAVADSWDNFRRLERKSESGADRWRQAFVAAVKGLADQPERRAFALESKRLKRPIREEFFKTDHGLRYRLIFVIVDNEVHVLRVRAPGQRPLRPKDIA
jgi:plasmid stabilization system protein ParE